MQNGIKHQYHAVTCILCKFYYFFFLAHLNTLTVWSFCSVLERGSIPITKGTPDKEVFFLIIFSPSNCERMAGWSSLSRGADRGSRRDGWYKKKAQYVALLIEFYFRLFLRIFWNLCWNSLGYYVQITLVFGMRQGRSKIVHTLFRTLITFFYCCSGSFNCHT